LGDAEEGFGHLLTAFALPAESGFDVGKEGLSGVGPVFDQEIELVACAANRVRADGNARGFIDPRGAAKDFLIPLAQLSVVGGDFDNACADRGAVNSFGDLAQHARFHLGFAQIADGWLHGFMDIGPG